MQQKKNALIVAAAIAILAAFMLVEVPFEGLTAEGWHAMGLLVFATLLWMTDALPMVIVGLLVISLTAVLGIMPMASVWPAAINQAFFFVIASFGLCTAVMNTTLAQRVMKLVLKRMKNDPKHIVWGFVGVTSLISVFITDAGTNIMMLAVSLAFFDCVGLRGAKDSRLCKCIMIGISAATMSGGIATPASNSINMLAISILEATTGTTINFLQWSIVGIPLALATTLVVMFTLPAVFKPEPINEEKWEAFLKTIEDVGPWTDKETKFIVILAGMIGCWVAGAWVPQLSIAIVAMVGVSLMVLPGIELFTGEQYIKTIQVQPMILFPSASVLGSAVTTTGLGLWFVQSVFSGMTSLPAFAILLIISIISCAAHIVIPAGPAVIGVTGATMITAAIAVGADPVIVAFILAFWGGATYILPIDGLLNVPYAYGYYETKELMRWGALASVISVFVVPIVISVFGMLV